MTEKIQRETAKIYQFPAKARAGTTASRRAAAKVVERPARVATRGVRQRLVSRRRRRRTAEQARHARQ